jgi:hypothetical protein
VDPDARHLSCRLRCGRGADGNECAGCRHVPDGDSLHRHRLGARCGAHRVDHRPVGILLGAGWDAQSVPSLLWCRHCWRRRQCTPCAAVDHAWPPCRPRRPSSIKIATLSLNRGKHQLGGRTSTVAPGAAGRESPPREKIRRACRASVPRSTRESAHWPQARSPTSRSKNRRGLD